MIFFNDGMLKRYLVVADGSDGFCQRRSCVLGPLASAHPEVTFSAHMFVLMSTVVSCRKTAACETRASDFARSWQLVATSFTSSYTVLTDP